MLEMADISTSDEIRVESLDYYRSEKFKRPWRWSSGASKFAGSEAGEASEWISRIWDDFHRIGRRHYSKIAWRPRRVCLSRHLFEFEVEFANDLSRKSFRSLFNDTFDKKETRKVFLLYEISSNRNKSSRRLDRSNKNFLFEQKKKKETR